MTSTNKQDHGNEPSKNILRGHLPFEHETTLYVFVSALDVFMTYILMRTGTFQEGNPVARYFFDRWGMKGMIYFKFGMVAFVLVLAQIIATKRPKVAEYLIKFATLVVGGVVVYSFYLFLRHVLKVV
ncbi:DUF5658 family protein [Thalassoroseus pseudoceratinae]|uniref:DUF5658 family protein n=1 Tax=Thalassoroseus pseudoceratinae TaxID=2713176 RepID=UPI001F114A39|nr:DUF5658 family protein [Thalassoroseus pseudoceratinae]